jgi:hypothetical protein
MASTIPSARCRGLWHAERVEPWALGLVAVIVVGLAAIVFGALWDRRRTRLAEQEMLAPPQRHIPQFRPDSPAPAYLSQLQARRPPEGATSTALSPAERDELSEQLRDPSTLTLNAGYASRDFVTDPDSAQAVLDTPAILVCADHVESVRELVSLLEKCSLSGTPLVVVAPSMSAEVIATLEVNQIRQTMRVLAVVLAAPDVRQHLAHLSGAQLRSRSDLQSGYVWPEHLGRCARWVSGAKRSHVISPARLAEDAP